MRSRGGSDIHVLRYFSSLVTVSGGRVVSVTEPSLAHCPLARHFYGGFRRAGGDEESLRLAVREAVESKIRRFGLCTARRILTGGEISIPFGASEMLMYALRKRAIDAAVVVCEGAGTVIVREPEVVQGIGARMHTVLYTTPVRDIVRRLEASGCRVVFEDASIDQAAGVEEAADMGFGRIAVTVRGDDAGVLARLAAMERRTCVPIISLAVCTTGVGGDAIQEMRTHADLVWSCASGAVREKIGSFARLQLSKGMPVFVLTREGIDFASAYARDPALVRGLDGRRQYLIARGNRGRIVHLGNFEARVTETRLPVPSRNAPRIRADAAADLAAPRAQKGCRLQSHDLFV